MIHEKRATPAQAIRAKCRECVGGDDETRECAFSEIENCTATPAECALHKYRLGRGAGRPGVKIIRKECIICMGGQRTFVKTCPSESCALWPYRLGRGYCTDPMGETWEPLSTTPGNSEALQRHRALAKQELESTNDTKRYST